MQVNVAYRWFLGLSLTDKVPNASTLSQNRIRRFNESDVYKNIFDNIVEQAMKKRMVSGRTLYTDSTHLKANANKNKHCKVLVQQERQAYLDDLDEAVREDRIHHGKKPLPAVKKSAAEREIKQSTTDADSGYMVRDGKPKGFFYLDHRSVDSRCNIITDVHVTAGNMHDAVPYLDRLKRQKERFGFAIESVGLDAGYFTAAICKGLEARQIYAVIGYRRPTHRKGDFYKREYRYDASENHYTCPEGQVLKYTTTNREGYRHYQSDPGHCATCASREKCTRSANHVKTITRHVWEDSKERINQHRLTDEGKLFMSEEKRQLSVVLRMQSSFMVIAMLNLEGEVKYRRNV